MLITGSIAWELKFKYCSFKHLIHLLPVDFRTRSSVPITTALCGLSRRTASKSYYPRSCCSFESQATPGNPIGLSEVLGLAIACLFYRFPNESGPSIAFSFAWLLPCRASSTSLFFYIVCPSYALSFSSGAISQSSQSPTNLIYALCARNILVC